MTRKTSDADPGVSAPALARDCPVCGRRDADSFLDKGALRLVRCRTCGMVRQDPVAGEFTSGRYYEQAGEAYYLSPAKLESDYADVRFERELRLFRRYCAGGAVLDVGCSSGAFLYQLDRRFPGAYDRLGTDVSSAPLNHAASQGVPVAAGSFPELDLGGKAFDAVTFWAVLEHLPDPRRFLERAAAVLKAGGLCFVLVPNLGSLAVRWLGARYRYIYPPHLNYFTASTLRRLAEARYSVLWLGATHFNPLVLWQDWRSGGAEVSNERRAGLLRRTTGYKQNRWLAPARLVYRGVEGALGRLGLADNLVAVLRKK
jgi:2-polyprenyl-3-methyl-5-hydroxy-6-metoxy-1,4-benzoquinol methylase